MKNRINHQNDVIYFRKIHNKMRSFDWKKNIEDSIKDRIIITATTTRILFALKTANIKPPKASLDAMDIMKLAGGICGGVLMKDYAVYKKWIQQKFYGPLRAMKLHNTKCRCSILFCWPFGPDQPPVPWEVFHTYPGPPVTYQYDWGPKCFYFSMVEIPLELVTLRWATAYSRLNT